LSYAARSAAEVISRVELWYTTDGQQWKLYSQSHDAVSPIRFRAAGDGLHGFFVVLGNTHGSSSAPPQPSDPAHHWALIDTTPPLVQIKQVQLFEGRDGEQSVVAVMWTAHDDHPAERPVSIYYQILDRPGWQLMAPAEANLGRFDWPVPEGVFGAIELRVEVVDRAGNRGSDVVAGAFIPPPPPPAALATGFFGQAEPVPPSEDDRIAEEGTASDPESRRRAQELYEQGVWRRQRGELDLAIQRLIEAMNLDPSMTTPAFELAEIYCAGGRYEPAIDVYETILRQHPADRDALRGMALAFVALKNYPEALAALEKVLTHDPGDAQAWLDAGDVFMWMGQRPQAVSHWQKARELSKRNPEVRRSAELKLRRFVG
jgi:predicted negative regulator of RcsB-dependent stress response